MPKLKSQLLSPILSEDVISFTECRNSLAEHFEKVRRTHRPIVVTQNGRVTSAIVSISDLEDLQSDLAAMRETLELYDDIRVAETEIERGETITNDEARARAHRRRGNAKLGVA